MTAMSSSPEAVEEAAKSLRLANAFFLAHLTQIVGDMSGLTEGDQDYDYFIPVPLARLHILGQQISDLQFEVKQRFQVGITALPVPIAD
ncbi:MAG TPA: hypothetical protein VGU66_04410 [Candidatus Elarobacter sp.]|nr:hypothetical protein [Candidatus Elarobacter sp.]